MNVTILQLDIEWGSPSDNIRKAEMLMDQAPRSDLYVLPEMWSTGFAVANQEFAEVESESVALNWMKTTARDRQCAICGSLAIQEVTPSSCISIAYRNRHYFVNGKTGSLSYYDKRHLFGHGGENRHYTAGTGHTIVNYEGFRLLLLTCYDLRFPIWSRYAENLQFDAIVIVANWPESRLRAWQILTRARAIENQAFLIACNRVGDVGRIHYSGHSAIISPSGETFSSCRPNQEMSVSHLLQLETLQQHRERFRFLDDRDMV